jgi:hypothetical protein
MTYVERRKNYPRVKDWRKRNPDKLAAAQRRSYGRKVEIIRKAKAKPCADCGIQYPYYVMQFDHVRGEKSFQIGMSTAAKRLELILEEIEKCEVVCANCHAARTFHSQPWLKRCKKDQQGEFQW